MKGIVWGNTLDRAIKKLEEIKQNYLKYTKEILVQETKDSFTMSNGDYWKAVNVPTAARGYKCNISYIDVSIPYQDINMIVTPATTAYPYCGYKYFDFMEEE